MPPRRPAEVWTGEGFWFDIQYHTAMVHAFIMVKTSAGTSEGLVEPIRELEKVSEAHIVAGDWDIVAEVDAEEVYDVLKTASGGIQALEGVTDTKTYISMDE
jgi:DNA-binding Lrp family transcriptional regulator